MTKTKLRLNYEDLVAPETSNIPSNRKTWIDDLNDTDSIMLPTLLSGHGQVVHLSLVRTGTFAMLEDATESFSPKDMNLPAKSYPHLHSCSHTSS